MNEQIARALAHLGEGGDQGLKEERYPITLNFHPDIAVDGNSVINLLAIQKTYRSQFETGTSSGGLSAHPGGDRWNWESRIFGGVYDESHPSLRPKYGAINHHLDPVGGSRRFGSCHLRLAPHVRSRTSFCYPDSHWKPRHFAVNDVRPLVTLASENELGLDPWLDNYIEAHIHGPLSTANDVDAVVLDPSFRGTSIEEAAGSLGCRVEWHDGFRLPVERTAEYEEYRGPEAASAITKIAEDKLVTPAILGRSRDHLLDYKTAKWVWHCIARFGLE